MQGVTGLERLTPQPTPHSLLHPSLQASMTLGPLAMEVAPHTQGVHPSPGKISSMLPCRFHCEPLMTIILDSLPSCCFVNDCILLALHCAAHPRDCFTCTTFSYTSSSTRSVTWSVTACKTLHQSYTAGWADVHMSQGVI